MVCARSLHNNRVKSEKNVIFESEKIYFSLKVIRIIPMAKPEDESLDFFRSDSTKYVAFYIGYRNF